MNNKDHSTVMPVIKDHPWGLKLVSNVRWSLFKGNFVLSSSEDEIKMWP